MEGKGDGKAKTSPKPPTVARGKGHSPHKQGAAAMVGVRGGLHKRGLPQKRRLKLRATAHKGAEDPAKVPHVAPQHQARAPSHASPSPLDRSTPQHPRPCARSDGQGTDQARFACAHCDAAHHAPIAPTDLQPIALIPWPVVEVVVGREASPKLAEGGCAVDLLFRHSPQP